MDVSRLYTVNGLNQYLSAGPATFSYDPRGNLTSSILPSPTAGGSGGDGSTNFTYDVQNRLISATGARSVNISYDPLGRLYQTSGGVSGTTRFLYDGDELLREPEALRSNNRMAVVTCCGVMCMEHRWMTLTLRYATGLRVLPVPRTGAMLAV